MEQILSIISVLIIVIGALTFVTMVMVEVSKSWGLLNKIPTALQVFVTAITLSVLSMTIYVQLSQMKMVWYYIIGAVILGYFVAYVAMNGWDKLAELWKRYGKEK